jgi:hypothetical protein
MSFMNYQKWLLCILVVGGALALAGEYFLVRWYPGHEQRVADAALKMLPYQNEGLGIQMEVAAGIYGKVQVYPGGIRIYRPKLFGGGPSITITSKPNTTSSPQFSAQYLAQLETAGVRNELSSYQFEHLTLSGRDAAMIWQYHPRSRTMEVTAQIMAPDRIVTAVCNTGYGNQAVYTQACDKSLRSIKLLGPPSNLIQPVDEIN